MNEKPTHRRTEDETLVRERRRPYAPPSLRSFGSLGQIIRGASGTANDLASEASTCPEDSPNVCS